MDNIRKSLRNTNHCFPQSNIFHTKQGDPNITNILPTKVRNVVGKGKNTSCTLISSLPPFTMVDEQQQQLRSVINAMKYQLKWQNQLSESNNEIQNSTTVIEKRQTQSGSQSQAKQSFSGLIPQTSQKKSDLWEQPYFLDKLDMFISSDFRNKDDLFQDLYSGQ